MKMRRTFLTCFLACMACMILLSPAVLKAETMDQAPENTEAPINQADEMDSLYKEILKAYMESFVQDWNMRDFEGALDLQKRQEKYSEKIPDWISLKKSMGSFQEFKETVFEKKGDLLQAETEAVFEKGTLRFTAAYDPASDSIAQIPEITIVDQQKESLGSRMKTAGMNTVMGIVIVFLVLIFISFVIWLFQFIPNPQLKAAREQAQVSKEGGAALQAAGARPESDSEELAGDEELAAVVTAAIMASMGDEAPADGLIVRSIKRKTTKRWKNA